MTEDETRAELIDPALSASGWSRTETIRVRRNHPVTPGRIEGARRGAPKRADYVLQYRGKSLAVIEAKPDDAGVTDGVGQAKDYAAKLKIRFAYSTNGKGIYAIDMETGEEKHIDAYPSPDELWAATFAEQNNWRDLFAAVPYEDKGGSHPLRFYQEISVDRVLEAIAANERRMLLTLATGTGKTFIAFQIAWKLFHSRWNMSGEPTRLPRILFLADRNNLANQAFNDFTAFGEGPMVRIKPSEIKKTGHVPTNGSIFFTIFQTFMSGVDGEGKPAPYFGEYPPDFFDFIIIDECHRGGANDESTWRGILEYFEPAVQLGLTATPKRDENVDTYDYFGEPLYTYSLKEGINDGFLTPFKVREITSSFREYTYSPDDEIIEGEIDPDETYTAEDINRRIEIEALEKARVVEFMNAIDQREKTIVFCANQRHAALIRDLINQVKESSDPNYCHRVTANDGDIGEQHLRDFRNNDKTIPTILTTSHKLSTGVDARNVRNIVLLRPIRSMIEFKQIVGRGTRLYDGKYYFTIYDFVGAHQHFQDPEWDGPPADPPLPPERPGPRPQPPEPPREPLPGGDPPPRPPIIRIKLSDERERQIMHTTVTSYWHQDGTPLTAHEFVQLLFGELPNFFRSEDELREIWIDPETRRSLLTGLAEKGFGSEQLTEMRKIIDADASDIFDVLANIAFAAKPDTRANRAQYASVHIHSTYDTKKQAFLGFVLDHYVNIGVEELDVAKLTPLLKLRYNDSLQDALNDLGSPDDVRTAFVAFQKWLYPPMPRGGSHPN